MQEELTEKQVMEIYDQTTKILEKYLKTNKATWQTQLDKLGKLMFGKKWKGVHASDRIPKLKNNEYAILNLDKSYEPGSHWVSLAKIDGNLYFYDSFGRKSTKILKGLGNGVINSELDSEQPKTALNCGQRSLSWLWVTDNLGVTNSIKI